MNTAELKEWLLLNGGPAIQLNIQFSQNTNKVIDINAVSCLLDIPNVKSTLDYIDGFNTQSRDKKTLEHLIHYYKDSCIEKFFPRLIDLGFRAGIPVFDEKMQLIKEIFLYMLSENYDYCYYYRLMLHQYFFVAGYDYPEAVNSMMQRLNKIHIAAKERIYEIYQDKSSLPKVPQHWIDRGVLKDDLNPFDQSSEKPLPTIYDIKALAYFPSVYKNTEVQEKINDVINYILDPIIQKIPEGYGLLWVKDRRIYQACGWSPTLPLYENYDRPQHLSTNVLLDYLEIMSNFKAAHKSKWFIESLNHFEQFKTENGTYIFPKDHFNNKYIEEAFLNKKSLNLRPNERQYILYELVSTLRMLRIIDRINDIE